MDKVVMQRFQPFVKKYFDQHPIAEIKAINRLTPDIETVLASLAPLVELHIEGIISTFYAFVLGNARSRRYFVDEKQIERLQNINRKSFVRIFTPPFDQDYFTARLRIGYVHYAIDLNPELYMGAIGVLESALSEIWSLTFQDMQQLALAREATARLLKVEVQLTLDTFFAFGRQDVEIARQRAQEVLDNLNEGFLTITPDLTIDVASKSCFSIFGADMSGIPLGAIPGIPSERAAFIRSGVEQYFENFMPMQVNLSLLPSRIQSQLGRVLQFNYTPVVNQLGDPIKLVAIVNDITDSVARAEQLERETQLNRILIHILRHKEAFVLFLKDTELDLKQLNACEDAATGKRLLHTLKGNSGAFGLSQLAALIHDIETVADEAMESQGKATFFQQSAETVSRWIGDFLRNEGAILELHEQQEQADVKLSARQVAELTRFGIQLTNPMQAQWMERFVRDLQLQPAQSFMSTYHDLVSRLGDKLGKNIGIECEGAETKLDPELFGPIFKQLVHALRNAIDHGIEHPEQRIAVGKSERALIRISVNRQDDGKVVLSVQDDGRGIDKKRLSAKALEKKFVTEDWLRQATEDQILGLIFADGVSTSEQVSDTSGRGVGMSALKAQVERAQGSIAVFSEAGKGTTLTIVVPPSIARTKQAA